MTTPALYDSTTTAEDVHKASEVIRGIIVNSGISANVLFTMFHYYANAMMQDMIQGTAKIAEEERNVP